MGPESRPSSQDEAARRGAYWLRNVQPERHAALAGDRETDVAIVGAGIVGLTTALLLADAGRRVAVIEARRVGRQVSGHTTAKITALHRLVYADLERRFDREAARVYGESNQAAIELIAGIVARHGIDCDFERADAYTFCSEADSVPQARAEAATAARLGLPASWTDAPPFPVPSQGAVRFANQAQFHPYKYLLGLARQVTGAGALVFEETPALDVEEGEPCTVVTGRGRVRARHVVLATNLPILDRGGYFARAFPRSHVVLAAMTDPAAVPQGMFISAEQPTRSVRSHRGPDGTWLVATGDGYHTGQQDPGPLLDRLRAWLAAHFPLQGPATAWTNEDFDPMDRLPFIGPLLPTSRHVWVATGFAAWGMTGGTVAAQILADRICGRDNPWAALYDTARLNLAQGGGEAVRQNLHVAQHWIRGRWSAPDADPVGLARGEAVVAELGGHKLAAFRDDDGRLHLRSAICTHMGCVVSWNGVARTWDCPCHGSRFEPDGTVLSGPATKPLPAAGAEG